MKTSFCVLLRLVCKLLFYHNSLAVYLFLNYVKEYWLLTLSVLWSAAEPSWWIACLLLYTEHEMLFQCECTWKLVLNIIICMYILKGHCLVIIKISKGNVQFAHNHIVSGRCTTMSVTRQCTQQILTLEKERKSKQNYLLLVESILYHTYCSQYAYLLTYICLNGKSKSISLLHATKIHYTQEAKCFVKASPAFF